MSKILIVCLTLFLVLGFSLGVLANTNTFGENIGNINEKLIFLKEEEERDAQTEQNLGFLITKSENQVKDLNEIITGARLKVVEQEVKIEESKAKIEELKTSVRSLILEITENQKKDWLDLVVSNANLVQILSHQNNIEQLQRKSLEYLDLTNKEIENLQKQQELQIELQNTSKEAEILEKVKLEENKKLLEITKNKQENYNILLEQLKKDREEIQVALAEYVKMEEENKKKGLLEKTQTNLLSHLTSDTKYESVGDCGFESTKAISISAEDFVNPTTGVLTSYFNCKHDGLDIADKSGTSVVSISGGTVFRAGSVAPDCKGFKCNGGFGNYVQIQHILQDGTKIYSLYGHMKENPLVKVGQSVTKGQQIGEVGCTGYTLPYPCGVHLHFMIFDDSTEAAGFGCRLGRSKCFDPLKLGFFKKKN